MDQCSSGGVGSAWCLPLTPPSQSWQTTPPAFLHSDTLSAPVSSLKNLIRRWPSTSSSWWQAASPPSRHKVGSTVSTSNEEFPQELFLAASRDNVRPSTLHTMQWSEPMVKPQKKKKMQWPGKAMPMIYVHICNNILDRTNVQVFLLRSSYLLPTQWGHCQGIQLDRWGRSRWCSPFVASRTTSWRCSCPPCVEKRLGGGQE